MIRRFTSRKLLVADANDISILHDRVFKRFFLTSLGINFLRDFYASVLSHENGIGIGVFLEGKLIGFAVGTENTAGFYSSIVKTKGISLLMSAFLNLLIHPLRIFRLISSLSGSADSEYTQAPSLLSICVADDTGLKGVGSNLIKEFEKELLKSRHCEVILTTDATGNDYVNQFYLRNHYICKKSFFNGKRKMNFYYKKLKL